MNKMNKEELQKIASTMTEEEFKEKYFKEDSRGDIILAIGNETYACPRIVGLKNINDCNYDCKKCWNNAIKELKFKGENEMKELNIIEASKMEAGTEFKVIKEGKEVRYILLEDPHGKHFSLDSNKGSWSIAYSSLIQAKFIPVPKEIEVDLRGAVKSFKDGKMIKNVLIGKGTIKNRFFQKNDSLISENILIKELTCDEILEGKWYVLD